MTITVVGKMASADDELVLLERVFLRVGSAETDEQLQNVLFKFLPPVLLKLASQVEGVRKKVMELLVHVNKRLKSRIQVQLPVPELLAQYRDPEISPFVTNFTILYIKMGYPRMAAEKQAELLPMLISSIEGHPQAQKDSLIQLVVRGIQHMNFPTDAVKSRALMGLDDKPELQKLLLDAVLDVLLLPYVQPSSTESPQGGSAASGATGSTAPPGLSEVTYKRAVGDPPLTPEELEKVKLSILNMLGAGVFPEKDLLCHLVVAIADARHSVVSCADRELKRITGNQDWNNPAIVSKLFSIFQGTVAIKGQTPVTKPELKRSAASIQLRMKIFPYLLKSRESVNHFPSSVQIIFDCLFGTNTNAKLKHMAVQFVHHMTLSCTGAKFNPISAVLLSGLVKLIGQSQEDAKLRGSAYVAVGKVISRAPQLVNKDISLLQTFFDAMTKEESDTRLAVQEALSLMASAFKTIDSANKQVLEALIMQNIEKSESQARLVAVQYAQAVFPADHIPSRYILLLAAGDLREEVYSEATKALHYKAQSEQSGGTTNGNSTEERKLPDFTAMVKYVHEKGNERLKTTKKYVMGNNILPFNPATYGEMLVYLRQCLAASAGVEPDLESVNSMRDQAPAIARYVGQLLKDQPGDKGAIAIYITIIRQLLTAIGGSPAMYCLLEVVAVARQQLAPQFIKHLDWIKNFMYSSREEMREYAAELYAVVVAEAATPSQQLDLLKEHTDALKSQALEGQHGSLLALGHLVGQICRGKQSQLGDIAMEDIEVDTLKEDPKRQQAIEKATKTIVDQLGSKQQLMSGGACSSLGELGRNTALPLQATSDDNKVVTKLSIVENLIGKVQSSKENPKVREKAALTLGFLCVGDKTFPHTKKVIEGLLDCADAKQVELHFTVGEALVYAALGPSSSAARDMWLVTEEEHIARQVGASDEVSHLLSLLLDQRVLSPNRHTRQAACIWLLSVARRCSKHAVIQERFTSIQQAFMHLLADSDELTQDIASKGLGVVYENCSQEQKDKLVSILIDTLTTGKKSTQTVTGDTELFQEGALGKTPDGQNLSTYKELCSIANDLNQPDLIYKFMHLANHNAIWNSRKGAAFGFTTIAAQAGQQLAPHLGKILPKLFRYQFDPNPRINNAMSSIWAALVSDSKGMVDKYLREIMVDLLSNLTNNQWRVRESSCLAVNDLLRGRALDDVVDLMEELWETLFRVRDDIKVSGDTIVAVGAVTKGDAPTATTGLTLESVRNAAEMALKTLSRVSIKMSDPTYGKAAEQMTTVVLPVLLKSGLGSQVAEVRALALATLTKMSKNAGPLLKPHIPVLVVALLESLSTLEHQSMNYLSLRVSGSQQTQDRLDSARIAASKTSPMMETINLCVQYIDGPVMVELVPRLTDQMRSAVGLGTKAGCAHFIIALTHHCAQELSPYAGKLLSALLNGLNDRNPTIRKAYATCIGNLVKVAKDSSVEKLILKLKGWYLEKEEAQIHDVCGVALHAINQHNPDVFKRHATVALPLVFLAMHRKKDEAEDKSKHSVWEEVWLDATPGSEAGVRLYLPELTELTQTALQSQSWGMKAQAAAAMNTMATKLGSNLGPPQLGHLLSALVNGLAGRTWTGKEALLQAIKAVCVSCKEAVSKPDNDPSLSTVLDAVMKECRKEKIVYKMEALRCIGPILETHEQDRYRDIQEILNPLIFKPEHPAKRRKIDDRAGVEVSEENQAEKHDVTRDQWLEFEACAYECLGQAWPHTQETQKACEEELCSHLSASLPTSVWRVQLAILQTVKKIITRCCFLQDQNAAETGLESIQKMISVLLPAVCQCLGDVKYNAVRSEAFSIVQQLYEKLEDLSQLSVLEGNQLESIEKSVEPLQRDSSPELQHKATTFYKALKK